MKPHTTWVVIADGTQGRILATEGPGKGLRPIDDMAGVNAADRDLGREQPGFDPGGRAGNPPGAPDVTQGRHGAAPKAGPHDKAEAAFLRDVAGRLRAGAIQGAYDRLVLVAPPKALGALRGELDKTVTDKVIGEVDKDLTNIPLPQLPEHLSLYVGY